MVFFFFMHKTAYEVRISDWSSDVCSADLRNPRDWCGWSPTAPLLRGPWAVPPRSCRHEQADRLRGDALAATDEAQRFAGRGLDADRVDVDIKVLRDQRAHRIGMRTDLRPLADHGAVGVAELPAALR